METVCCWHVRILLRITVARILWEFDFLRGLAPGRLDGFSIGRYEKNRESGKVIQRLFIIDFHTQLAIYDDYR